MKAKDLLTILIVFLLVNYIFNYFAGPKNNQPALPVNEITIKTVKTDYGLNDLVSVKITNNTPQNAIIKKECPKEPLDVMFFKDNKWIEKTNTADIKCDGIKDVQINPGEEKTISYSSWNHALFGELGKYKIRATVNLESAATASTQQPGSINTQSVTGTQAATQQPAPAALTASSKILETPEFEVKPQGWFGLIWTVALY